MPQISKAERRETARLKGKRHKVHAGFAAQYQAMQNREDARRIAVARRLATRVVEEACVR